eukprot:4232732-Pyramimonas_sp.AAC.2
MVVRATIATRACLRSEESSSHNIVVCDRRTKPDETRKCTVCRLWSKIVQPGDTVVDGTVGNGYDTAYLTQVGSGGFLTGNYLPMMESVPVH